jgi:hypothetical protein
VADLVQRLAQRPREVVPAPFQRGGRIAVLVEIEGAILDIAGLVIGYERQQRR